MDGILRIWPATRARREPRTRRLGRPITIAVQRRYLSINSPHARGSAHATGAGDGLRLGSFGSWTQPRSTLKKAATRGPLFGKGPRQPRAPTRAILAHTASPPARERGVPPQGPPRSVQSTGSSMCPPSATLGDHHRVQTPVCIHVAERAVSASWSPIPFDYASDKFMRISTTGNIADQGPSAIQGLQVAGTTPDGRLSGYLRRRQLPSRISIRVP